MTVFTATIAHQLQKTLQGIVDDKTDGYASNQYRKEWAEEESMDGAYVDFLEMGGPGLVSEKPEGVDALPGSIREGALTRAIARTFAMRISITEEAMDDGKYPEGIKIARRLKRALYKTQDIDMTNVLVRGWNTAYVGGDSQPLFSASHTLPDGGTFSNTMATPMSASRSAVLVARALVRKMVGHDGTTEGYQLKKVVCPVEQESIWEGILGSEKVPESNANEINVVRKLKLGLCAIPYWSNTATNYAFKTDCDGGPTFYERKAAKSNTWVGESQMVMHYLISGRWARIWTDARSMFGVQA